MDRIFQVKQAQKLFLSHKTTLIWKIINLPIEELEDFIEKKIDENPILEKNKKDKNYSLIENIVYKKSLYSSLIDQAKINFSEKDFIIAGEVIGNLDKKGFFKEPYDQIVKKFSISEKKFLSILNKIHFFDPVGVASKDLQERILIQLKFLNKKNSLLYKIIKYHFKDFLKKTSYLIKKLNISEEDFKNMKKDFKRLKLDITSDFLHIPQRNISADIYIHFDKKWKIEIKTPFLKFHKHIKTFEKKYIDEANFLSEAILIRKNHLKKISFYIIENHENYLLGKSSFFPSDIKETYQSLNIPKSTFYKIISQKYIDCPLGILPINYFFSKNISNKSNIEVLKLLKEMIEKEKKPLSDKDLCKKLLSYGIVCSRRAVAKYRKKLLIPNSSKRRYHKK